MMINKRLINLVAESKKYIAANVLLQLFSLFANIIIIMSFVELVFSNEQAKLLNCSIYIIISIVVKYYCTTLYTKMSYLSSKNVKQVLRELIYKKLLGIGASYNQNIRTSEVVQLAVDGVGQLESYFGAYLPQFFYAMIAPVILFVILAPFNLKAAIILFVSVPLIPVSIAVVQTFAKKLLSKYWGSYAKLGDTFLENLQGMITLKIYQSDEFKHNQMNQESEKFRKITMKVLVMQLNSITVMDLVAYGGTALGIIISVLQFSNGNITAWTMIFTILISADFFLPMRLLGSFFHIAMNGMAASEKIFKLLDSDEPENSKDCPKNCSIILKDILFSYDKKETFKNVDISIPKGSMISIVGKSGCGKTTIASLLCLKQRDYLGEIILNSSDFSCNLSEISEESLMQRITYIGFNSHIFQGTVRENLQIAKQTATEDEMWEVLTKAQLADFCEAKMDLTLLFKAMRPIYQEDKSSVLLLREDYSKTARYTFLMKRLPILM